MTDSGRQNLLLKIGGVGVLHTLVDTWYTKMQEAGLQIEPSLLDSIVFIFLDYSFFFLLVRWNQGKSGTNLLLK